MTDNISEIKAFMSESFAIPIGQYRGYKYYNQNKQVIQATASYKNLIPKTKLIEHFSLEDLGDYLKKLSDKVKLEKGPKRLCTRNALINLILSYMETSYSNVIGGRIADEIDNYQQQAQRHLHLTPGPAICT